MVAVRTEVWTTVRENWLFAVKAGAAAVAAWLLARWLLPSGSNFYAPLVAVLSVHPTVVRTLRDTAQRLSGVGIGLALGYLVVITVGLHWWSLGAVLTVATLISTWRRLDAEGVQVPIAALLVLLFARNPTEYAAQLLGEGVIGALAAAAVNLVVLPPLYVRTADSRLVELRAALGDVVDSMSRDIGRAWPPESPDWLERARSVSPRLEAARQAVERGSESTVLNPRGRAVRERPRLQRQALSTLEHVTVSVRDLAGTLEEATDPQDAALGLDEAFRPLLAEALHSVANALTSYGDPDRPAEAAVERHPVDEAAEQVRQLELRLAEAPVPQAPSLLAEGALVTELDLLVRELQRVPGDHAEPSYPTGSSRSPSTVR